MRRIIWGLIKLLLASLIAGWVLGLLGITPDSILKTANLTVDDLYAFFTRAWTWMAPRLTLGALVVVPIWLSAYLFMPHFDD